MFFRKKKSIFLDVDNDFCLYSLYDRNLKKFYSLVVSKDAQHYVNSLCYAYEMSKDNELLKVNKDNLDLYLMGFYNATNGLIKSKVEYIGSFKNLVDSYDKKKFKGGKDGTKSKKD